MASPAAISSPTTKQAAVVPNVSAREALMAWYRGEFAAANAMIDALCHHITQIAPPDQRLDYEAVFAAIHRRRLNWVPLLHLQKYFSIAEVALELRRAATAAAARKSKIELLTVVENDIASPEGVMAEEDDKYKDKETVDLDVQEVEKDAVGSFLEKELSKNRQINDAKEERVDELSARIKITKGFVAKEAVKGHMVNVVKGLKMYEDVFTESEIDQLNHYVNELRLAGRRGELSGETFILFKQQKGNKREIIQLGTPIFEPATSIIDPIPVVLHEVIDQLIRCRLLPETRKPNSCIINFFDEGEFSQPYMKPPHVEQPMSTLVLSESSMAFGRILVMDDDGNFKGPLMLPLKQGSLLVMRGNSADMARHVMCPSSNKRITLTFVKVRSAQGALHPANTPPLTRTLALWQPGRPYPYKLPSEAFRFKAESAVPKWGYIRTAPMVMLAPAPQAAAAITVPAKTIVHSGGGTGVFLPWSVGSRKPAKHVPPRIQRGRLLFPSSYTNNSESGQSATGNSEATV